MLLSVWRLLAQSGPAMSSRFCSAADRAGRGRVLSSLVRAGRSATGLCSMLGDTLTAMVRRRFNTSPMFSPLIILYRYRVSQGSFQNLSLTYHLYSIGFI